MISVILLVYFRRIEVLTIHYSFQNISLDKDYPNYVICYRDLPLREPNLFIKRVGTNSIGTLKHYGKTLTRFFNYFEDEFGIRDYRKIKLDKAIDEFMRNLIYHSRVADDGTKVYLTDIETKVTLGTAYSYMARVQNFYYYLDRPQFEILELDTDYVRRLLRSRRGDGVRKKQQISTQYRNVWNVLDLHELAYFACNTKWKRSKKVKRSLEMIEIDLVFKNLLHFSLRDACIFLMCLETGARISEILHVKYLDLKKNKNGVHTISIYSTKNYSGLRYVVVPKYLNKLIVKYMGTKRKEITGNLPEYRYLFVSNKGVSKGMNIKPGTFSKALKKAARMAGLEEKDIVSHLSRATKATLLKADGMSEEEIKKALGNKVTINPYLDFTNSELAGYYGAPIYSVKDSVIKSL